MQRLIGRCITFLNVVSKIVFHLYKYTKLNVLVDRRTPHGKSGYNECQNRHVRHWEIIKVILSVIGKLSTDKLEVVVVDKT